MELLAAAIAKIVAAWLGHKDGVILMGKVYGHLLDEHRKRDAAGLTIGLVPVAIAPPSEMSGTPEPMRASRRQTGR